MFIDEILTKIENMLTRWPVAQIVSNFERKKKTGGRKFRWIVSLISQ